MDITQVQIIQVFCDVFFANERIFENALRYESSFFKQRMINLQSDFKKILKSKI